MSSIRWFATRVLVIALPVLEVLLLVWVGRTIGWGWTIALLLAGLGLGLALMRVAGVAAFQAVAGPIRDRQPYVEIDPATGAAQTVHPSGQPSAEEIQRTATSLRESGLLFVSGLLFAIPGFLTDVLAAVLALPFVRRWAARRLPEPEPRSAPTVIRGETVVMDSEGTVVVETWTDVEEREPPVIRGEVLPPPRAEQ